LKNYFLSSILSLILSVTILCAPNLLLASDNDTSPPQEQRIKPPDVQNMSEEDAKAAILAAGLTFGRLIPNDIRAPEPALSGKVNHISYPTENTYDDGYVKPGTPISLALFADYGIKLPALAGMTEAGAEAALIAVGLAYGGATVGPNRAPSPAESGRVESYGYPSDADLGDDYVRAGTSVTVKLYKDYSIQVPNVLGMTADNAKAIIIASGLAYGGSTVSPQRARTPSESGRVNQVNYPDNPDIETGYVQPGASISVFLFDDYSGSQQDEQPSGQTAGGKSDIGERITNREQERGQTVRNRRNQDETRGSSGDKRKRPGQSIGDLDKIVSEMMPTGGSGNKGGDSGQSHPGTGGSGTSKPPVTQTKYLIWTNNFGQTGRIHAGTEKQYQTPKKHASEWLAGTSQEYLKKTKIGGPFSSQSEAKKNACNKISNPHYINILGWGRVPVASYGGKQHYIDGLGCNIPK
jgi:beta-lactam-binding protein with PASTA domain